MKRIITIAFIAFALVSCRKQRLKKAQPTSVDKQISFNVYAAKNYVHDEASGSPWRWASGSVKLTIESLSKGGQNQTVWDTTFVERRLIEYPLQENKLNVVKNITVLEPQEELLVKYEIIYAVPHLEPQRFGRFYNVQAGQKELQVAVEL